MVGLSQDEMREEVEKRTAKAKKPVGEQIEGRQERKTEVPATVGKPAEEEKEQRFPQAIRHRAPPEKTSPENRASSSGDHATTEGTNGGKKGKWQKECSKPQEITPLDNKWKPRVVPTTKGDISIPIMHHGYAKTR